MTLTRNKALFILLILGAFALRVYGIAWDGVQHLHPDERFLAMVSSTISLPENPLVYFVPDVSPLNPYNNNFEFFVYGTLPITLNKLFAVFSGFDKFTALTLSGRLLSALADVGTLMVLFLMARLIEIRHKLHPSLKYFAGFVYAIAVLPIQQSHFFTTDTFAVFFNMVAVYAATRYYFTGHEEMRKALQESGEGVRWIVISAVGFGAALASKASAVYVAPLIALFMFFGSVRNVLNRSFEEPVGTIHLHEIMQITGLLLKNLLIYGGISYLALRIGDPHIFLSANIFDVRLSKQYMSNLKELELYTNPNAAFPPAFQWRNRMPIVFPLSNIVFFGFGVAAFAFSVFGMYIGTRHKRLDVAIVLAWVIGLFLYLGTRDVMTMRYFYPLYPFLALFAGFSLEALYRYTWKDRSGATRTILPSVLVILLIWPLMFMRIYTKPHPYITASEWIYENVSEDEAIINQHWDDPLPIPLPPEEIADESDGESSLKPRSISRFAAAHEAHVFIPDTPRKKAQLYGLLSESDYFIVSTNRTYEALFNIPDQFPFMTQFYKDLFSGELGYEKVAEFTRYPGIPVPSFIEEDGVIEYNDQWAEEAFTVYDHPRVMIFKKVEK